MRATVIHRMKPSGFTLIELLIVVAIIAILAAIAVPNFLEAQTRSKVSRCVADMRTIATAYEAYAVDHNRYIPGMWLNSGDLANPYRWNYGHIPYRLTTPVAYLATVPFDAFADKGFFYAKSPVMATWTWTYRVSPRTLSPECDQFTQDYWNKTLWPLMTYGWANPNVPYIMTSVGPDRIEDLIPVYHINLDGGGVYDPSNGTVSSGDIVWKSGGGK